MDSGVMYYNKLQKKYVLFSYFSRRRLFYGLSTLHSQSEKWIAKKLDNEWSTSQGDKATMQSEMSRTRYASCCGENFLNYRVESDWRRHPQAVFQEYLVRMKRVSRAPFSRGRENNGETKGRSQVIYVMCNRDSSFDTCRYLTMKDSQRPVVTLRNFTPAAI